MRISLRSILLVAAVGVGQTAGAGAPAPSNTTPVVTPATAKTVTTPAEPASSDAAAKHAKRTACLDALRQALTQGVVGNQSNNPYGT